MDTNYSDPLIEREYGQHFNQINHNLDFNESQKVCDLSCGLCDYN